MDEIAKALKRLNGKERKLVRIVLGKILLGDFNGLNVKKLKGKKSIFRVRKSSLRIIFRIGKDKSVFILTIERRTEKTYKKF